MLRGLPALLVLLLLLAPGAAAFAATRAEVSLVYGAEKLPGVLAAGEVSAAGTSARGLLFFDAAGTRFSAIPRLVIGEGEAQTELAQATVEIASGSLLWQAGAVDLDLRAPYGVGLALADAPLPGADGARAPGFLLAGPDLAGTARAVAGEGAIIPLDAVVTVRDARGAALAGWDARRVNAGATSASGGEEIAVAFATQGAFDARVRAGVVGGAAHGVSPLALRVGAADEDRLPETLALLARATSALSTDAGARDQLDALNALSGVLNGALVIASPGGAVEPREARFGDAAFAPGAFAVLRGDDLALAWERGEMRVSGEPSVALGRDGFAVDEPARLGLFPVVSLLLWCAAIGAMVWFVVRRPPTGRPELTLRMGAAALWLLVLVGVFVLWDRSFQQTFGAGVLSTLSGGGFGAANLSRAGALLLLELVPWGVAALLFALPVRIALGVALRYLGRGKSLKGVAAAGGLLSLALFGPAYALWCFNLVWTQAMQRVTG